MLLIPEDILQTLEFNRIQELAAESCCGDPARAMAREIKPLTDRRVVERRLSETMECARTMDGPEPLPLGEYMDIESSLRFLEIIDYILEPESLLGYRIMLRLHQGLETWATDERMEPYPVLVNAIRSLAFDGTPLREIDAVFDEKGVVKDDASPELLSIRRRMEATLRSLDKTFATLGQAYRKQGWLTESGESIRNGRRVFMVPAEYKRKIKGIIHDESASGRTVFLEPDELVELNNALMELESEERLEIQRILRALCNRLRPFVGYFKELSRFIIRMDMIRSKALVSRMFKGVEPRINEAMQIDLRGAFHPLLYLRYQPQGRTVVPFDLTLSEEDRILVLSGPNAGGKSITMKSVLLIQLLAQSGFLIPARQGSSLPVYQKCFADIGDRQSLEDDLSTYSSKLRNLQLFLASADKRTLIALDEFGSGTDPKLGGAIAEAILHALNRKRVMGVVTTHYSNLKVFAFKQKGLVNGAMVFDQDQLRPAYSLSVGKPGSSYAFEIATSSGLPEEVLRHARNLAGVSTQALEQLLVDLQQEKRLLEERLSSGKEKEARLDQLIRNYEQLFRDLEYQRKRLKVEARELVLQQKSMESMKVEEEVRALKEERSLEKALERKERLRQEQEKLRTEITQIRAEANTTQSGPAGSSTSELTVGGHVRLRQGGAIGEVISMDRKQAQVAVGDMTLIVPLVELEVIQEPLNIRTRPSVRMADAEDSVSNRLDIRGFKKEEALRVLELFLDKALLGSSRSVRILHGKGSGALRRTVFEKAREYKDIRAIEPAGPEDGGEGVTIIRFG